MVVSTVLGIHASARPISSPSQFSRQCYRDSIRFRGPGRSPAASAELWVPGCGSAAVRDVFTGSSMPCSCSSRALILSFRFCISASRART